MTGLTFVIPWHNRPELQISLEQNRDIFSEAGVSVLLVNGGGDCEELHRILARADVPNCCPIDMPDAEFNKCCSLNVGVACSDTEDVFLLDADVILDPMAVSEAREALVPGTFVTLRKAEELRPEMHENVLRGLDCLLERRVITELTFRNERTAITEFWHGLQGRSLNGLALLSRSDYIAVGGCNSQLSGWGFEDQDFQIRLQVQLGLKRLSMGSAIHITHAQAPASERVANEQRNVAVCFENYNNDRFLGTFPTDVAEWLPKLRELRRSSRRCEQPGAVSAAPSQ